MFSVTKENELARIEIEIGSKINLRKKKIEVLEAEIKEIKAEIKELEPALKIAHRNLLNYINEEN